MSLRTVGLLSLLAACAYLVLCRRHVERPHPLFSDPWYMTMGGTP
jgi:hypothetical protein